MRKMWDLLAIFVSLIFSIILWFNYFGAKDFTVSSVISTGIVWILGVVIIGVGAKLIGWLLDFFDAVMDGEIAKIKTGK